MTTTAHILDWIAKRLREEIIDNDRSVNEAVDIVMDALNREDRKLLVLFMIQNKAYAFFNIKREIAKMLESDT